MKRATWLSAALVASMAINVGIGVSLYRTEHENRQALAYSAQRVSYRLLQLERYADDLPDPEWEDPASRAWVAHSIQEVTEQGLMARRIPARGLPRQVGERLGRLADWMNGYLDVAGRIEAAPGAVSTNDKAEVQKLAQSVRRAGWTSEPTEGSPVSWTYGRDWAELNRALESLLAD